MKRTWIVAAALCCTGLTAAQAGPIGPNEVKFTADGEVTQSLTGVPGDPANGRKVFMHRKKGNCLACHQNSDMKDQLFHGEIGPSLDGVGSRYSEAKLRGIVVNAKVALDEDTIMPAFYRTEGLKRVLKKFQGKTILTAQEVEDVVAYLMTLKDE